MAECTAVPRSALYPQYLLPVVGLDESRADTFDLAREAFLLRYALSTARAYWSDLDDWRLWCEAQQPAVDPLDDQRDRVAGYELWLEGSGYSRNTTRRRVATVNAFLRCPAERLDRQSKCLSTCRSNVSVPSCF